MSFEKKFELLLKYKCSKLFFFCENAKHSRKIYLNLFAFYTHLYNKSDKI